jgi:hypothetical protein
LPQIAAPALATAFVASWHALGSTHAPTLAFGLAAGETIVGILWLWRLPVTLARE